MIKEGKIPKDRDSEESSKEKGTEVNIQMAEENMEPEVIKEMVKKYYRAIEFYTETKKPD